MKKFVYLLFLLLPFIDLGSSITARFLDVSISIGGIIKGLLHIEFGNLNSQIITNKFSNITMIFLTIISSIAVYSLKNIAIFLICIFLWVVTLQENKIFNNKMKMYELFDSKNID